MKWGPFMSVYSARKPSHQNPAALKTLEFFNRIFSGAPVGPFAIRLWNGSEWRHGKEPPRFTLELKHPGALLRMFWRSSELSLGEAFIYDDFDIHGDMEACFELAGFLVGRRWGVKDKFRLGRELLRLAGRQRGPGKGTPVALQGRVHSKQRDAEAVQYHYNVSNEFYRLWLGRHMVYSCAFFHDPNESLDQAQVRKLDYLCRKLRLKPGEKLLDIGCGWGGLILHAARSYGVEALGVTLSQPQADLADERIRAAGLAAHCRVEVRDYRDLALEPQFDKLVSVGMFEHVGEAKLPEYFGRAYQLLKPRGVFLNHGINQAIDAPRNKHTSFIDKYVFPDGELVPLSTSLRVAEEAGFEIRDVESLREHYAMTLRRWYQSLQSEREKAIALTSPVIYRIWQIYMAGSAYGFETRRLGLNQTLLVKSQRRASGLPLTRCDWYQPCPSSSCSS